MFVQERIGERQKRKSGSESADRQAAEDVRQQIKLYTDPIIDFLTLLIGCHSVIVSALEFINPSLIFLKLSPVF